jgi:hypothetical protein
MSLLLLLDSWIHRLKRFKTTVDKDVYMASNINKDCYMAFDVSKTVYSAFNVNKDVYV